MKIPRHVEALLLLLQALTVSAFTRPGMIERLRHYHALKVVEEAPEREKKSNPSITTPTSPRERIVDFLMKDRTNEGINKEQPELSDIERRRKEMEEALGITDEQKIVLTPAGTYIYIYMHTNIHT